MLKRLTALFARNKRLKDAMHQDPYYRVYREAEQLTQLGYWELDFVRDTLWWSDKTFTIFRQDPRHFTPTYEHLLELVHPDDRDLVNHAYQYSVENHKPYEFKHRLLLADGSVKYVIEKGRNHYDRQGRIIKTVGSVLDVTTLENLEAQVRLTRKMESLGLLAGGIAHDFNNLIGVITGYASMVLERTRDLPDIHNDVQEILRAANKSAEITRQLLTFSSSQQIDPVVVNLNERVLDLDRLIHQLVPDSVSVSYQLAADAGNILIGMAEFDQVIINLVSNAAQAMPDGGTIRISTRRGCDDAREDRVYLAIEDNGNGIPSEYQERIFEPFFTTRRSPGASGLGLATVFNIVNKNRGIIDFNSELGCGSCFTISFPLCRDCGLMESCKDCFLAPGSPVRATLTGLRIMLVEDDDMVRNMIENMLIALGCQVSVFRSSMEAEAFFLEHNDDIDVVISDIVMPIINGPELIERMRRVKPDLPALFMSGYTAHTLRRYQMQPGDAHFIPKPFSMHGLRERLYQFVRQEGSVRAYGRD